MKKILVFGGYGFLGYYLVNELLKRDYEVTVADIEEKEKFDKHITYIKCDINCKEDVESVFKNKQFAVERNYFSNELVFANHLLSVKDEEQIEKVFYGNNKKIPKEYLNDIIETSKKLTYSHKWKKNQIIMIDNYRFMHGRNKINGKSKREIINSQTLITNF